MLGFHHQTTAAELVMFAALGDDTHDRANGAIVVHGETAGKIRCPLIVKVSDRSILIDASHARSKKGSNIAYRRLAKEAA